MYPVLNTGLILLAGQQQTQTMYQTQGQSCWETIAERTPGAEHMVDDCTCSRVADQNTESQKWGCFAEERQ